MLLQVTTLLLGAVLLIPLAKHLGLGAVLGYLIAGVALGPWGLGLIQDVGAILHFGEFGVILLLFVIGLELKPSRLWVLRRPIFGLGGLQVVVTALAFTGLALAFGLAWKPAIVIGLAVAMSSTAMVLQTLAERNQLPDRHGRDAFAVLLFQDMAVIPVLAVLPMLGQGRPEISIADILQAAAAILGVVLAGRVLVRPAFSLIARLGSRETFTAASLLVVVATTLLMEWVGLSASLGAFLAGVVLADSEFRHELEADLEPFKGLLLGLFFMAVGMGANLGLLLRAPLQVVGLAVLVLVVKAAVLLVIARAVGRPSGSARKLAIALAQGGEFAFVVFQLARQESVLELATLDLMTVAVTLSMLLWPLVFVLEEKLLAPYLDRVPRRPFDQVQDQGHPVVIAGLGRVGQIVARILAVKRIPFTVLEADPQQVDFLRRFGNEVYYGDASRLDVLEAAGVGRARVFVLAIDDVEASLKTAALLRKHYPGVPVIARARNRFHAYKLMDLGVDAPMRETLHSSLVMAESLLKALGLSADEAASTIQRFAEHDAASLRRQHAVYEDEARLVASIRQARDELRSLFDQDTHNSNDGPAQAAPPA